MLRIIAGRSISKFGKSLRMGSMPYSSSSSVEDRFRAALDNLNKLSEAPGNDVKLKLYGLFKQATLGECTAPKPSMLNIVDKAKWEAWSSLGKMSTKDAMEQYISTVNQLLGTSGGGAPDGGSAPAEPQILVSNIDKVCWIKFNRPKKFNAITSDMYESMVSALQNAGNDESIKLAVITGSGDYYSSGNDLSTFLHEHLFITKVILINYKFDNF